MRRPLLLLILAALALRPPAQDSRPASAPRPAAESTAELLARVERERHLPAKERLPALSRLLSRMEARVTEFLLAEAPLEPDPLLKAQLLAGLARRAKEPPVLDSLPGLWERLDSGARSQLAAGLAAPLPEELLAFLQGRFGLEEDLVRASLVRLLALPEAPGTLAFLARVLAETQSFPVLRAALSCLKELPASPARESLLQILLRDPQPLLRAEALRVLDGSDPERLVALLKEALDREVRLSIRPLPMVAEALAERLAEAGTLPALHLYLAVAATRPIGLAGTLEKLAAGFRSPPCLEWWLGRGCRDRDAEVRLLAIAALAASGDARVPEALRSLLRDRDEAVARAAARALGRLQAASAAAALEQMLQSGPVESRIEALDALHQIHRADPAWRQRLLALTSSRHQAVQARALDLLADLGAAELWPKVERLARTRSWQVRSAVYSFAAALREPRAIPVLIERLAAEEGRLRDEVERALHRIAGVTFGYDPARWRAWWAENGGAFRPPPAAAPGPVARQGRYGNTYYGIPIISNRVIFVMDVSGSMLSRVGTGGRTRLDLAKEALAQALAGFAKEVRFNIVFFQTTVQSWEKELGPAVPAEVKRALAYVRGQEAAGATNLHGALEKAFADPEVDTLYVLSDGAPTAGEVTDPERLAELVLSWNRTRRLVIHTVSLGTRSGLLQRLAEATGGQYVVDL